MSKAQFVALSDCQTTNILSFCIWMIDGKASQLGWVVNLVSYVHTTALPIGAIAAVTTRNTIKVNIRVAVLRFTVDLHLGWLV